jgi:hypothetical protein
MKTTFYATWDGEVLRPHGPLPLSPNSRVHLSIEQATDEPEPSEPRAAPAEGRDPRRRTSFLTVAMSLEVDGPPDWSSRFGRSGPD